MKMCAALLAGLVMAQAPTTVALSGQVPRALPATPAAARLTELVDRYNAGQLTDDRWARWRSLVGQVTIEDVTESTDTRIRAWIRGTVTRGWLSLLVRVKAAPPHELDGEPVVFYGPIPALGPEPAGAIDRTTFLRSAETYLQAVAEGDFFSGAMLVAVDSTPVLVRAYGAASREYGVQNNVETRFNLASVTKMLTAVAIAQLADRGKLSLDDTVVKHLPDYALPNRERITIHQLLTHTAGLGRSEFHDSSVRDRVVRSVPEQLAKTLAPPEFAPGASARYNNEAWVVLGAIIERVSGQDYYSYVNDHIYRPAGMTGSGRFDGDLDVRNRATGYANLRLTDGGPVFAAGPRRNTLFLSSVSGSPSGGTYSTVSDLFRFLDALRHHKLLSPEMTGRVMTQHATLDGPPGLGERRGFAYGLETRTAGWLTSIGKSGGAAGASAEVHFYPKFGCSIIVLSNYDGAAPFIERHLRTLMVESANAPVIRISPTAHESVRTSR